MAKLKIGDRVKLNNSRIKWGLKHTYELHLRGGVMQPDDVPVYENEVQFYMMGMLGHPLTGTLVRLGCDSSTFFLVFDDIKGLMPIKYYVGKEEVIKI